MSFRSANRVGRSVRPAQVFKKRNNPYDTLVGSNADAVLLSEIVLRETGTIYSVKISAKAYSVSADGDSNVIRLWIRCVPAQTTLPDLTAGVDLDTMNGFYVGQVDGSGADARTSSDFLQEKFRFRRKCDENSLLQLLAQSTNVRGAGQTVEIVGVMVAVIRVK